MVAVAFTDLVDGVVKLSAVALVAYALIKLIPAMRQQGFSVRIMGTQVTVNGTAEGIEKLSDGVEAQIDRLREELGVAPREATRGTTPVGGTVLWVDDRPANNLYEVGKLTDAGFDVTQVTSTQEARTAIEKGAFDVVITDMGRMERGRFIEDAGVQLTRWIRDRESGERSHRTRIIVFCSPGAAARYGDEARRQQADLVTASTAELLGFVA